MANPASGLARLHQFLGIGLIAIAAVFLLLRYVGIAPIMRPADQQPAFAYVFGGIGIALLLYGLLVVKPRAPARDPTQSVDQFWSTPANAAKVLRVWFVLEGAGMLSAVGFLMTGSTFAGIVMVVAIGAYWMCGPTMFAKP
jgi:hypothetical protein